MEIQKTLIQYNGLKDIVLSIVLKERNKTRENQKKTKNKHKARFIGIYEEDIWKEL